jgi:manganese transport system substrate-binding protein
MTGKSIGSYNSRRWRPRLVIVGVLLGAILAGCQTQVATTPDRTPSTTTSDRKVVLTTFTVLADMAQNVAGDKATIESITKPGTEVHGYQVTPSDLARGQRASLIFENGLNLERWAERFYNSLPKVPRFTLSQGVQPIAIAEDAYKGKPNPHAWMSPQNALIYVENIRQQLGKLDPTNAAVYDANAAAYSAKIRSLDTKLKQAISVIPTNRRFIVSCEGAFTYLARDYGLQEVYLWAVNSEQQSTPRQVEKVIDIVRKNQVPAVFCESTVNDKSQRQVAKETGAKFGGVFYVDSLSPPDGAAPTYLKLLEHNITTLINGLKSK